MNKIKSEERDRKVDLAKLIPALCLRPAMYTGVSDSNIDVIVAFIEGMGAGDPRIGIVIREFNTWLVEKFKRPPNWGWSGVLTHAFPDSETATKNLPLLFDEFVKSQQS